MIEAKNLCLRYADGTLALHDINLHVEPGELVYITGPSGSGKTSLLKLFMGVEFPTSGTLKVLDHAVTKGQASNIRRLRMALGPVFQDFKLVKGRSSLENIMLGMRFFGFSSREIKENAREALIRVGLEHKAESLIENLSWGESQRVSIARAVVRKPALILADEPTGNLDRDNALNILEILKACKNEKTAVIITTHATHLINENDGRLIRLNGGAVERTDELK
ncbi:MAG: ATP-binding cassette domain-containing protein [Clostridiales bacterium]|jgi:cell division transport system ATP-binding protein|nr:ATP-binding cassette domain-containing protein [Clostridiales bacterium]